jgi:iron complex outermembrane receptor protein
VDALLEGRADLVPGLGVVGGTELIMDREQLPSNQEVLLTGTDRYRPGDAIQGNAVSQGQEEISNLGVYGQASWDGLAPYVNATGGVRYDYHSIYGGQLSGRAGAVSNPVPPLYLKLLYGTAFKAPSPLLLYAQPYAVGDVIGNPELKPQRVHTVEAEVTVKPHEALLVSTDWPTADC